ncbi:L-lactate permease [Brevibacillus borstelensis]|uniref:L-lactate permease n=1 Tax=Brevibacillus borstelensis TaxID=45462 RepID=UPI0030BBEECF
MSLPTFFYFALLMVYLAGGWSGVKRRFWETMLVSGVFVSPVIGGMGGFLTGSNTGSNVMFIKLQTQTAAQLGTSPELVAYGQNTASSHSMMDSPSRVLLGATMGGERERA